MKARLRILSRCLLAFGLIGFNVSYGALSFDLNYNFSGTAPSSPAQPWANVLLQSDNNGGVYLQVTTPHLTSGSSAFENISELYLNFNPNRNISLLSFSQLSPTDGSIVTSSIQTQQNAYKADGDGYYDINLGFPTGQSIGAFGPNERLLYDIRYSGGTFSISDFLYGSVEGGGAGTYYAAAHVQNTANGAGSCWIGAGNYALVGDTVVVPEPGTVWAVFGGLLAAVTGCARKPGCFGRS